MCRATVRSCPYRSDMAKPLEEWSIDELRMAAVRVPRSWRAVPRRPCRRPARSSASTSCAPGELVRGVAWDETFTLEMVEDELALHERKAGQELGPLERERLTQLWLALRTERYRDAA